MLISILQWDQNLDLLPLELIPTVAEQLFNLTVHELNATILADDDYRPRRPLPPYKRPRKRATPVIRCGIALGSLRMDPICRDAFSVALTRPFLLTS
jgi:hypothetical protein